MTTRRILGIDPGLASIGIGIIEWHDRGVSFVKSFTIHTKSNELMPARLLHIQNWLHHSLFEIDDVALELLPKGEFMSLVSVAEAIGVMRCHAWVQGFFVHSYSPSEVKRAVTGTGNASKVQVAGAVVNILGDEAIGATNHETDALAVALTHFLTLI